MFIVVGALLPLLLWLKGRRQPAVGRVLPPYLLLLAGQITTELAVVLVGGVFTLVRLGQLMWLLPRAAPLGWLRGLLLLELGLWGLNAAKMLLNRWLPLLA